MRRCIRPSDPGGKSSIRPAPNCGAFAGKFPWSATGFARSLEGLWGRDDLRKIFQEQIITLRNDRYVVAVKAENKNALPGIIHDQSQSRATFFIEPLSTLEENNELNLLLQDEKEEERRILLDLTTLVRERSAKLQHAVEVLGHLDLVLAKAKWARAFRATIPSLNSEGYWFLREARHPLLEPKAVPMDLQLAPGQSTLIIIGGERGREDGCPEDPRASDPDRPKRGSHPGGRGQRSGRLRPDPCRHRRRAEPAGEPEHLLRLGPDAVEDFTGFGFLLARAPGRGGRRNRPGGRRGADHGGSRRLAGPGCQDRRHHPPASSEGVRGASPRRAERFRRIRPRDPAAHVPHDLRPPRGESRPAHGGKSGPSPGARPQSAWVPGRRGAEGERASPEPRADAARGGRQTPGNGEAQAGGRRSPQGKRGSHRPDPGTGNADDLSRRGKNPGPCYGWPGKSSAG